MKKYLALVLALIMCVGLLSGCGQAAAPAAEATKAETAAEPAAEAVAEAEPAETDADTPLVVGYSPFNEKFSPFFSETAYDQDVWLMTQISLLDGDRQGAIIMNGIEGETINYNGTDYTYYGPADCVITENDDGTSVEAEYVQDHSDAYVLVDGESIGTSFYWEPSEYTDEQAEEEIKAAWENLFPEDSGIYPGMRLSELRITDEMLQAIRDCGEKNSYGAIEESSLSVNGLFIALFDNEDGWSLYINGDDTYIQFHTDNEEKYLTRVYISGEANTWFM